MRAARVAAFAVVAAVSLGAAGAPARPAPFRCPPVVAMPREMAIVTRYEGRQTDPSFSTLNADKVAAQQPERAKFTQPVSRIIALADMYRAPAWSAHRDAIGGCLAQHFAGVAASQAMEGAASSEDHYYRDWMIAALAVSYLKAGPALEGEQGDAARQWFDRVGAGTRAFHAERAGQRPLDNHSYWGAFAVAASGRVAGNEAHLAYGRDILSQGLRSIDGDGLLATELRRGKLARHYHVFAAAPLAALALITGAAPDDVNAQGFSRLIVAILDAFDRPDDSALVRRANAAQAPGTTRTSLHLLQPFVAPDPALQARLAALLAGERSYYHFLGGSLDYLIGLAAPGEAAPPPDSPPEP